MFFLQFLTNSKGEKPEKFHKGCDTDPYQPCMHISISSAGWYAHYEVSFITYAKTLFISKIFSQLNLN